MPTLNPGVPMPTAYRKEALKLLLEHTEGWRLVLERVLRLCQDADTKSNDPQWPTEARHDAIGRKQGLLQLIQGLYHEAELPSPFDTHYVQLLTSLRLTPPRVDREPEEADATKASKEAIAAMERLSRRNAGSVA